MGNEKYALAILKELGMSDCKGSPTPITCTRLSEDEEFPCDAAETASYRKCVGIGRFHRNFAPETNYAIKELSHGLAQPNAADFARLRRYARYLKFSLGRCIFFP